MRGLALGVLDPRGERYRLAQAHRDRCPACRAYVRSLARPGQPCCPRFRRCCAGCSTARAARPPAPVAWPTPGASTPADARSRVVARRAPKRRRRDGCGRAAGLDDGRCRRGGRRCGGRWLARRRRRRGDEARGRLRAGRRAERGLRGAHARTGARRAFERSSAPGPSCRAGRRPAARCRTCVCERATGAAGAARRQRRGARPAEDQPRDESQPRVRAEQPGVAGDAAASNRAPAAIPPHAVAAAASESAAGSARATGGPSGTRPAGGSGGGGGSASAQREFGIG